MADNSIIESSTQYIPKDLAITSQPDSVDKDKFKVVATGLKTNLGYAFQFQYVFEDGSVSPWSPGYSIGATTESVPGAPSVTVPSTAVGSIPVTLTAFPANAKRVDIKIIGGEFGTGKIVDYFLAAGTKKIAVVGGTYQVSLLSVTPTSINGDPTETFTIVVSTPGETIQAPTSPNGFSSRRILAGIEVSWAGTYSDSTFTGFEAIKIYAGTSATATSGTYTEVGVMTANNVKNSITVPVDGVYVAYGQAVYIHAAALNKNGTVGTIQANVTNQPLGPGKATDADINDGAIVIEKLASNVLTVGNLKAGDINATSYIRAGSKNVGAGTGARVELSSALIEDGVVDVQPGFYIYNSAGTPVLSAPLGGGLSIVGSGTFSGALSGASGSFTGDITAGGGLFSVSNGILTAAAGTIGGWQINDNTLRSSAGSSRIILNPQTPKISLYSDNIEKITIDPIDGIKGPLIGGNAAFQLQPSGSFSLGGGRITYALNISTNEYELTVQNSTLKLNIGSNYDGTAGDNTVNQAEDGSLTTGRAFFYGSSYDPRTAYYGSRINTRYEYYLVSGSYQGSKTFSPGDVWMQRE